MSRRQYLAYLGCSLSIGIFSAFNNFTLTLWLAGFTSSYLVLGLLGNSKSFEGAFVSPVFGVWSDRLWLGWLGRRRPFILVGGLLSALILACTPAISRWPVLSALGWSADGVARLIPAVVAIFLFTLTFNTMDDIHKALLADVAGPDERNALSAWSTVVNMAGQVGILILGFVLWSQDVPDSAFVLTGALVAVGVVVTVAGVREPAPAVWAADRLADGDDDSRPPLREFLARYRGAAMLCLVIFAYWSGVNAVMPLVSVYTRDILGATVGEAQLLPALLLFTTTAMALPVAWLADRYGKRRLMAIGFVIMGCAALAALVITTKLQGAVVFLVAGIGNAGIVVLTIPLLADLVPRRHMGAASGLLAAAGSIAAPLASILAGALSDLYGPRAIFAMMAAMIALAFALLPAVKSPAVADEPPVEPAVTPEPAQAPAAPAVPPAPDATSSPVSGTQRAAAQDELAAAPAESAAEPRPG